MRSHHILVIEDNLETAKNIRLYLEHHGYRCKVVHSGSAGVAMMSQDRFHLVILDIMLPDLDGFQVCEKIRTLTDIPIIMLTARIEDRDLVAGFARGADDYVKKPYSNKELMARVQAHLRRYAPRAAPQRIGPFELDADACLISLGKTPLPLTKTEFLIFRSLLQTPGRVFSRERLCEICIDEASESTDRTVDVHVHNLRKKIVKAGLANHGVTAVYGLGYKWIMP